MAFEWQPIDPNVLEHARSVTLEPAAVAVCETVGAGVDATLNTSGVAGLADTPGDAMPIESSRPKPIGLVPSKRPQPLDTPWHKQEGPVWEVVATGEMTHAGLADLVRSVASCQCQLLSDEGTPYANGLGDCPMNESAVEVGRTGHMGQDKLGCERMRRDRPVLKRVLLNLMQATGSLPDVDRYRIGALAAEALAPLGLRISVCSLPERITYFAENTAVNRGLMVSVWGSREQALAWLVGNEPPAMHKGVPSP